MYLIQLATISGIISAGAKPVLCDVKDNYLMDDKQIDNLINKHTKVIMVVHIYGYALDLKNLKKSVIKKFG